MHLDVAHHLAQQTRRLGGRGALAPVDAHDTVARVERTRREPIFLDALDHRVLAEVRREAQAEHRSLRRLDEHAAHEPVTARPVRAPYGLHEDRRALGRFGALTLADHELSRRRLADEFDRVHCTLDRHAVDLEQLVVHLDGRDGRVRSERHRRGRAGRSRVDNRTVRLLRRKADADARRGRFLRDRDSDYLGGRL